MATQLQIKRSTADVTPTITYGELAYSTRTTATGDTGGGYIWVADSANAARVIGGDHFVKMLDHTAGTLTANNAIVVDSSSKINQLLTANITVGASNLTFGATADIVIPDANAAALQITDGTNNHLTIDSSANTVKIESKLGGDLAFNPATSNITFATAMNVKDQAGTPNTYLSFGEVAGTKTVTIGQALDIGANNISTTGDITAGSALLNEDNATLSIKNTTDENANEQADTLIKMLDHKSNELGKIVSAHEGTGNDAKGQMKIYTGSVATDTTGSAATEAISIASDQKTTFKGDVDVGVSGTAKDLTVWGNFDVKGTTTTIDSTTITVDDKNIELGSVATPTDTTATGGGITLKGASDKTIIWDDTNNNWTFDTGTGTGGLNLDGTRATDYKIANVSVLNATTLGGAVVNSSLTNVGTLTALTVSGATALDGGLTMDTNKFTVANTSGNVATAGTLDVAGLSTLSASANVVGDVTIYDPAASASPTLSIGKDSSDDVAIIATTDSSSRLTGVEFVASSTGTFTNYGFDESISVATGKDFQIADTSVLNATTLGTAVLTSSLTSVGILGAGSIAAGFGAIDNGTSNITTGGILKVDADGTAANAAGSITLGAGNDAGIWVDSVNNLNINNGIGTIEMVAGDVTIFDTTNNGDPSLSLGSVAAEALKISVVQQSTSAQMSAVKFETAGASATDDVGEYQWWVDGTHIADIKDDGHFGVTGTYTNPVNSASVTQPMLDNFTIDGGTFT